MVEKGTKIGKIGSHRQSSPTSSGETHMISLSNNKNVSTQKIRDTYEGWSEHHYQKYCDMIENPPT